MSVKVYKWGIIGCGNVTEVKSGPAYQKVEGFELKAVMRRDIEKAEDYANRHGVSKFYGNADDLINDPEINAIYIATPPDSHLHYALKVAKAGKVCCIEKPMAPSYKECEQIVRVFKEKELPLFVAYYRRSLPRFEKIKALLDASAIGSVRHINWHYSRGPKPIDLLEAYDWRTDVKIAYGGYFDDLASHGLDLFIYLLGNITEAKGLAVNQQDLYSSKDAIVGSWLHHSGITGSGSWNFGTESVEDKVEIYGSNGKITFSVFKGAPIVLKNDTLEKSFDIAHPENIQLYHVENMKKQLFSEIPHPSTGETGAHTSWVMDKILDKN
ncbi:Gfo/Idh/MocA family protein [Aquimarina agarilytica]|uniref:Gfo/Idh/MocA family protein n=1 Tax=Aquimarina agarilytica TaxID=1087449 RepID=UPI00028994F9|nr:Gfo/Idh/MocA family oxidoreductase [Aquimarina agarilytica]